jgi:hypothetical protein
MTRRVDQADVWSGRNTLERIACPLGATIHGGYSGPNLGGWGMGIEGQGRTPSGGTRVALIL